MEPTAPITRHLDMVPDESSLGLLIPPYRPTFPFMGPLTAYHRFLETCPRDGILIQLRDRPFLGRKIAGWLRREDALKLYELAYLTTGDVLELGTYHGLSTSILARALRDSDRPRHLYANDLDEGHLRIALAHLRRQGLAGYVTPLAGDGCEVVRRLAAQHRVFSFVFIDHSHTYQDVLAVGAELRHITAPGGFCLFHDYNDARNLDPADVHFGVYQAAREAMDESVFEFCGVYGCTGLYRRL